MQFAQEPPTLQGGFECSLPMHQGVLRRCGFSRERPVSDVIAVRGDVLKLDLCKALVECPRRVDALFNNAAAR
ncbi:hypothetical protein [Streptomyces sp. NPDC096934]|uniref:hypothetical protein n=1 Tax=Streptomyces sp. NPDC096934 TaxID=3155551 RepID=UPI00331D5A2F